MSLPNLWFVLVTILFIGYLVLEGFDFGVGALTTILPRGDYVERERERRLLINTIGPVWDGNEVWLITAGGAVFAAFPEWYATMFSSFYLLLLAILVALILRACAFEYRGRINSPAWRRAFDWALAIGSWVPAFVWGVILANQVRGLPLDANYDFIGSKASLLNPFALLGGLATLSLCLLHGATFLGIKTTDPMRTRAHRLARILAVIAIVLAGGWAIWAQIAYSQPWTWVAVLVAALALVGALVAVTRGSDGQAFLFSTVALVAAAALIFGSMYPYVIPGLGTPGLSLEAASSSPYTLRIMTIVALILTPIVIAYQAWTYRVFRRRLSTSDIPPSDGLTWQKLKAGSIFAEQQPAYVETITEYPEPLN